MAEGGQHTQSQRSRWLIAAAIFAALLFFLAFLIASYPYKETVTKLLAPYHLKLTYADQQMSLPWGVRFDKVELLSTASRPNELLVSSNRLTMVPTLGSLLLGAPALRLQADLYSGTARATVLRDSQMINLDFRLESIDLAASQPLRQLGTALRGRFSSTGTARISGPALDDNHAAGVFRSRDVTVEVAKGFPLIHLGSVTGRFILDNRMLTFQQLQAEGGDFTIKADGVLQLAPEIADSEIDARVFLTPAPSGRDHFGLFLRFLPHPPAAGPYYIHGPLTEPSIR
jgi:type II secretion system protein N